MREGSGEAFAITRLSSHSVRTKPDTKIDKTGHRLYPKLFDSVDITGHTGCFVDKIGYTLDPFLSTPLHSSFMLFFI